MGEGPVTVRAKHRKPGTTRPSARPCWPARARRRHHGGRRERVAEHGRLGAVPATTAPSSWTVAPRRPRPIKHLVVIFDENVSFDHYFGTYPYAANTDGSTFKAKRGTPRVNGLYQDHPNGPIGPLLTNNPNLYNPQRLTHARPLTCDQNHGYTPEQQAVNGGKMDKFVQFTESASTCNAAHDRVLPSPAW